MAEDNPSRCESVLRRLDDYLDRELTDAEMAQVREHLETCAQCAREHRFEARVLDRIRSKLGQIQAPDLLLRRVAKALDAERDRPS